ncbi:MAG TPA: hypothetical protein VHC19_17465 [Pirellulales bacterium]|jgi:hypothetical protein|nr:hypothetical protein [Pirellulales bacterium]
MKRFAILSALLAAGFVVHASTKATGGGPARIVVSNDSDSRQIADIRERIDKLQAELDGLKAQLKALEARPPTFRVPPQPRLPSGRPIPPNWERREFNGQDVYIIPLDLPIAAGPPGRLE